MSNDKLLRSFIEASGFDIEEVESQEVFLHWDFMGQQLVDVKKLYPDCGVVINSDTGVDIYHKVIDYKVTKKEPQVCFDINSPEWGCICDYIISHRASIESGENDYGDLKPMLDYFNRNCTYASDAFKSKEEKVYLLKKEIEELLKEDENNT